MSVSDALTGYSNIELERASEIVSEIIKVYNRDFDEQCRKIGARYIFGHEITTGEVKVMKYRDDQTAHWDYLTEILSDELAGRSGQ